MNLPLEASLPRHTVFYFDYADPASYVASALVPRLCRDGAASCSLEPVDSQVLATPTDPDWRTLTERAASLGLPLVRPARFPFDSHPLLRTSVFVRDRSGQEAMAAVADRIWRHVWALGEDPEDPDLLLRVSRDLALPEPTLREAPRDDAAARMLARLTERAAGRGVARVPALLVEGRLFQALDGIAAYAAEVRPHASGGASGDIPDWTFSG
ncbi:MAG: DsbA family protein [Acidobacteria bacterium]|nr:DsbA family protein [Acidobacteriota bacterium]